MNKDNIISVVRFTFISICLTVSAIALYQVIFVGHNEMIEGFLTGFSVALLLLIPIMFSKKGMYVRRMSSLDERDILISIIANYLTFIVFFFAVVIFFINHLNNFEISYLMISVKLLAIVAFKFYINYVLRKFL